MIVKSELENNGTFVVMFSFAWWKQWSAVVCILHFVLTVILIYSICEHQEQEPTILIVCSQCAMSDPNNVFVQPFWNSGSIIMLTLFIIIIF